MAKTNFDFLKEVDKDLFEIITDAEKLYRDEYFEQSMGQARRFGEHICRNVLGSNRTTEVTFDEMLATLKDKIQGFEQEKEFIDDLYFLKKNGNLSVHSAKVQHDGTTALECLQRAFEVGISYAVYNKHANENILKLQYDVELLVTGNQSKKSLSEKYVEAKDKAAKVSKPKKTSKKTKEKKEKPQVSSMKSVPKKDFNYGFWITVGMCLFVALILAIYLLI
jgi:hypothetical protein